VGHASSVRAREGWINDALICVYDEAGNVIETHEHAGDFKEWWRACHRSSGFRFLNAERFGTILAMQPFNRVPARNGEK
jgi:hypothetical protein